MIVTQQPRIKERWSPTGRTENTQDYYVVREAVADYSDYWAPKVDPDGVLRDRDTEAERLQFVEDTRYIADFINLNDDIHYVLDFGAGLGWLLRELPVWHKAAVEQSPQAIRKLQLINGVQVYSDLGEVQSLCYNAVIAHHVIEHLIDPLGAVIQFRRILEPGGWLILATPDFGSPCARRFGPNYRMLHDKTHCSLFTLESCSRMLRDHGFEIRDVQFPFPERYATAETMERWKDTSKTSPPFPGNWMTLFCQRS